MWYCAINNFCGRDESIPSAVQCKCSTAGAKSVMNYCHAMFNRPFLRTGEYRRQPYSKDQIVTPGKSKFSVSHSSEPAGIIQDFK